MPAEALWRAPPEDVTAPPGSTSPHPAAVARRGCPAAGSRRAPRGGHGQPGPARGTCRPQPPHQEAPSPPPPRRPGPGAARGIGPREPLAALPATDPALEQPQPYFLPPELRVPLPLQMPLVNLPRGAPTSRTGRLFLPALRRHLY